MLHHQGFAQVRPDDGGVHVSPVGLASVFLEEIILGSHLVCEFAQ